MSRVDAAAEIARLSQRILELAPIAGLYVGITIEPAKTIAKAKGQSS